MQTVPAALLALVVVAHRVPSAPALARQRPGPVEVLADGFRQSEGDVKYAVFDRAGHGTTPVRTGAAEIRGDRTAAFVVEGLAVGEYSLVVFHDINLNGDLDRGAFGRPIEPYTFSRNVRGRFGTPSFEDTRFALTAGGVNMQLTVK